MKNYDSADLRTVALVGHGKCGKTSLGEAILFNSKATTRLGKVDNSTSHLDTEPEETKHKSTIQCALGWCEWQKKKIQFIDTPGDHNFAGDQELALSVVDGGVLVVSAPDGVQVGTEEAWHGLDKRNIPRAIFVNKLDRDRADFGKVIADIKEILTDKAVPLQIPWGAEGHFKGVIDLLDMKALTFDDEGRKVVVNDFPSDLQEKATAARDEAVEAIASTDDALIETYLESGELEAAEIARGLRTGLLQGKIVPVLCGAATTNIGVQPLLDLIDKAFPAPPAGPARQGKDADGKEVERKPDPSAPFSAQVFKTIGADVGKLTLLRVISGKMEPDTSVYNSTTETRERIGQIYALIGKQRDNVPAASPGDLVGLAKLRDTKTGDTLCDEKAPVIFPQPQLPEPAINFVVRPKTKGDEEKVAAKLHEILLEDTSLRLERDETSKEMVLCGLGQSHIELAIEKLKRLGVDVELDQPKVPYREAIKGTATDVEGKHKKQSGGRGQFGVCFIDIEPKAKDSPADDDPLEFVNAIFGGSIPRQFIPSVEKGIRERMARGVIAGFPVEGIKITLKDGKYHPVDSDGRSFEMAGSKGFQEAFKKASPILLEPIMALAIICPEENMGDVIGDISSRRGKVQGTEVKGRNQVIRALVPLAEVLRYAVDLESITGGRGHFKMSFSGYDEVPNNLAEKIIANANVAHDE